MTVIGDAPNVGAFEYTVLVQIWLPLPHADLLHRTATSHYDWKVQHSAKEGAINGLRNRALFYERDRQGDAIHEHAEVVYLSPLRFGELDTAMKAMDGCRPKDAGERKMASEICAVLRDGMARINKRSRELNG